MVEIDRRQFLASVAGLGAAALSGCVTRAGERGVAAIGFASAPFAELRTGHIGLGRRGPGAVRRLSAIIGARVAALCDLVPERVAAAQSILRGRGKSAAEFSGAEGWKGLCESPEVDLVFIATPSPRHAEMALYAMECGKHVAIEAPAAMTVDDCWRLVEASERTRRHCVQLESAIYAESRLLALGLVRGGFLGELLHGESDYAFDARAQIYAAPDRGGDRGYWRLKWRGAHAGDPAAALALAPMIPLMNINRGDRFDYLVSVQTDSAGADKFAAAAFGAANWRAGVHPAGGDAVMTAIRTVGGRTLLVRNAAGVARPPSRFTLLQGTKGVFGADDGDFRCARESRCGEGAHAFFDDERKARLREEFRHPLWRGRGKTAAVLERDDACDWLQELRLVHCLRNGLPTDADVYDLAAGCAAVELSERSCRARGEAQDVPDFTRGGWRAAAPRTIGDLGGGEDFGGENFRGGDREATKEAANV